MKRIAVVDNEKLKDMDKKKHIQSLCPVNRSGTECIKLEGTRLLIDEATCIGCGICTKPADGAIGIINLPSTAEGTPMHRYGENGFALYSLPTPIFGKVVGILGQNGIGKSTAMKILAGMIKPNFGEEDKKDSDVFKKLIEHFKGSEAQKYFENVRDKKIKISFKPQHVDLIPKAHSGTVRDLLEKADEKGQLLDIAELLELTKVLDRDIQQISGGELQRVAIAATVLKKANLYIFDEPTSYLDISQRIKVSRFIRQLADKDTAVLVVEHDLIILDYMTDLVHLMYGKMGGFGVVSGVKPTKAGINVYLSGFLKEENVRFRDHSISFNAKPPELSVQDSSMVSWKGLSVAFSDFKLDSGEGEIMHNQVIGVLGPNGIGKTTFVKMLAGVQKPDSGELSEKITVAYKSQYLEASDEYVASVLGDAMLKYDAQLVRPLQLKDLLEKKLNELSGGELQRVAIAICLAKDAELYLLDEPSAYLDVEQRLVVSKVIQDIMDIKRASALVVDHDILFTDYLSERLVVVEGVPAEHGTVMGPYSMEIGMNRFLKELDITMRRDMESNRPRVNKKDSQKDQEQTSSGNLYYG